MGKQVLHKAMSGIVYVLYLVSIIMLFDVFLFHKVLGFGYPRDYEQENIHRFPAPYVEFTAKPYASGHNKYGFRGPSFDEAKPGDLKVAFFGGSTGWDGRPPIPNIVEKELATLLGQSVFVANYSVVSSNHRQHLHGIIEYLPQYKPDLIVFYGGYNETMQSAFYDPRPGYPYNFFYRAETSSLYKLLLENSAIIGEVDKKIGFFTGLARLQKEQQPLSDGWNKRIVDKYFETLELAHTVAHSIESQRFGTTRFIAFYQPYQVPGEFTYTHDALKNRIGTFSYVFDVSSEYDVFGKNVYKDIVHVQQEANDLMGKKIAMIIAQEIKNVNTK